MHKTIMLVGLLAVTLLYGGDRLQVSKIDGTNQLYSLATVNSLTFTDIDDPGTVRLKVRKYSGAELYFNFSDVTSLDFSGASDIEKVELFKKFGINLLGNYPNPFNPTTTVSFTTSTTGLAKVEVFNQTGQQVSTIYSGNLTAGTHSMPWNAINSAAGTYFVRISLNGETVASKMLLVK